MKKYVKCFSNGNEALQWEDNNCNICKNRQCYPRKAIELGWITGHITWDVAKFIGFKSSNGSSNDHTIDDYCTLNDRCNYFNKTIPRKPKKVKPTNELTLF